MAMFSDSFGRQLSELYADDGEAGSSNRCGADVIRFYIEVSQCLWTRHGGFDPRTLPTVLYLDTVACLHCRLMS